MKITKLSLAALAAVGMVSVANADVDFKTTGQTVVYYQTMDAGQKDLFNKSGSQANAGIQLNMDGDLGNDFTANIQASALNTVGLEGNLVNNVLQSGLGNNGDTVGNTASNYFAITKASFTKKVGGTSLTLGRQELPKSLSPFAFTEGWNVFKNTFDAAVAINSGLIPDTVLVGAYVSKSNSSIQDISSFNYINSKVDSAGQGKGVYMLTAQNKSVAGLVPTLSYYQASSLLNATWLDIKADLNKMAGVPVSLGLQGGQISVNSSGTKDSKAMGIKVSSKVGTTGVTLAYSKTNNGTVAIHNLGTGVKTPLYTQMILNQVAIKKGADTVMLKAVAPVGAGKLIAQYAMTTANAGNAFGKDNNYQELDVVYKFKALGTNMLAAYVMQKTDNKTGVFTMNGDDTNNVVRVWSRYNF